MSLWTRIANVFRRRSLTRDIDEELASHLAEAIAEGRDPDEVRRAFGPLLRRREDSMDMRLLPWLDSLRADAIFGWRQIRKSKITSAAAILSLALATGACTSAFRLVDALLFRPLPVAAPERLYVVAFQNAGMDGQINVYDSSSYPMFLRMREAVKDQAELLAVSYAERIDLTFSSDQEMERANRQHVSGRMFPALGLKPALGRLFNAEDDVGAGGHPYAVISYDYWTRRFGRDPKAIGKTFRVGDTLYQIVGITQEPFSGTETGTVTDIFLPMSMKDPRTIASYNNFWLRTLVQLKPGVAPEPVRDRLRVVFQDILVERAKGFAAMPKQRLERYFQEQMLLEPAAAGRSNLQRDYRRSLAALGVLVGMVLLIACANVANLMTARATARAREMALRVSIGAGPARLVQMVLVESISIAILASLIGAIFAWWAAPFVVGMINPSNRPAQLFLPADWRVIGFALILTIAVTCLFGLAPALRVSAIQPVSALKGDDPLSKRRLMHGLIAVQVAFCFVVHFVAGLFVTTFERLSNQPTGFSAERLLNLETATSAGQTSVVWDQVADRLRELPGVEKVALVAYPLMSGESAVGFISVNGAPANEVFADFLAVSPGWLDTMHIPLVDGRDFRSGDATPKVAMVNRTFAQQYFDGADPVGKWFEKVDSGGVRTRVQIVALVGDARARDMRLPIRPTAYIPFATVDDKEAFRPIGRGTFVVRTLSQNPLGLASTLRQAVAQARPGFHVSNIRTQIELNQQHTIRERLLAMLAMFFAAVALLLAGIGLYGVLDYSVQQRRREIGIRMAIGAQSAEIARRVTVDVLVMVLTGSVAGLLLGIASTRYFASLLYGVTPTDIRVLALPTLTILAVTVLASVPAVIRAVCIDPGALLRSE